MQAINFVLDEQHCKQVVAEITLKLDISTGDLISPHAQLVTMPRILGGEFTVMGHAPETVIAEKADRC